MIADNFYVSTLSQKSIFSFNSIQFKR